MAANPKQFPPMPSEAEMGRLYRLASDGNNAGVAKFLDKYPGAVDKKDACWGWTALISAACRGRADTIDLLLKKGANIDAKTHDGNTALMVAVMYEKESIVTLLMERGADLTKENMKGQTALEMAKRQKDCDFLVYLLETWPEKQKIAADHEEITKTIMGGLTKSIPAPRPSKFKPK